MSRVSIADSRKLGRVVIVLALTFVVLGALSIKRIVNGNGDLSGNYAVWRANLREPVQPGRHLSTELRLGDPDPYPPITYAIFAQLARMPLWLLAALWFLMNIACTLYLWNSLEGMLDEMSQSSHAQIELASGANCSPVEQNSAPRASWLGRFAQALLFTGNTHPAVDVGDCVNRSGNRRIMILAGLAVLPSWVGAMLIGQNTLLVMTLITAAYRTDICGWARYLKVGALLVLAVAMKVLPAVFLLPFLMRRQFRILASFVVCGCILLFGIGSLFFGVEKNREFHSRWLQFAIQGPENRPPDPRDPNTLRGSLRDKNQAIEAVLARLLMDIPIHSRDAAAPHVNLMAISPSIWRLLSSGLLIICVLIGVTAIGLSLRAVGTLAVGMPPGAVFGSSDSLSMAARRSSVIGQLAILAPTQLFVSPVLWSHYYLWLIFPIALCLLEVRLGRREGIGIYVAWIVALPCLASELCRAVGLHLWMTLLIYVWTCWPALRIAFPNHSGRRSISPGDS